MKCFADQHCETQQLAHDSKTFSNKRSETKLLKPSQCLWENLSSTDKKKKNLQKLRKRGKSSRRRK